ncbi:MAG: ATP-binding protein [bacterium]
MVHQTGKTKVLYPLAASRIASRIPAHDLKPLWISFSFHVGLFHPHLYVGLSRRFRTVPFFSLFPNIFGLNGNIYQIFPTLVKIFDLFSFFMYTLYMVISRCIKSFITSSFVFGPRGTGKTTWLKQTFPDAIYIDLLDSDTFRYYSARPERITNIAADNPGKKCIIIDEVQKIPELLQNVHRMIENDKTLQFILTGSSSRKLKRKGVDLLAGRAVEKHFHPFIAHELGSSFNLEKALVFGMVPLIVSAQDQKETQKSYINLYLNEEIKEDSLTRNIGNFNRFLEVISFSQGSVLNCSEISRDSEVKRNTVDSYMSILEDLLIGIRIPVFQKRAKRALINNRKFYFFDCGVFQSLRPRGPLDDTSSITGIALETLIMQHLRAWIDYSGANVKLYFWRSRGGIEVDFVLYGENTFHAFEVKNTMNPRGKDSSGLREFVKDYPEVKPVLLYRGNEIKHRDGIPWIPVDYFLRKLSPGIELEEVISG